MQVLASTNPKAPCLTVSCSLERLAAHGTPPPAGQKEPTRSSSRSCDKDTCIGQGLSTEDPEQHHINARPKDETEDMHNTCPQTSSSFFLPRCHPNIQDTCQGPPGACRTHHGRALCNDLFQHVAAPLGMQSHFFLRWPTSVQELWSCTSAACLSVT